MGTNMTPNSLFDKHLLLQFKAGLREQQRELQHAIETASKEIRELSDPGPRDALDVSCFHSSKESMFARSSQNRRQLRLVELALERIGNGSFGTCATCGGAIGLKRLQALPWANHCIQCQEQSEQGRLDQSVTSQPSLPVGLQHSTV
jgi:DnaK suppressor protein